jgi:sulfur-oxidizing protein SoxA
MQDWPSDNRDGGRPGVVFGRRASAREGAPQPAPNDARPIQVAPPQVPLVQPLPPNAPAKSAGPPVPPPARPPVHGSPPPSLPLSSQQLQLFSGPMGAPKRPPQIELPPEPPPLFDQPAEAPEDEAVPPPPRRARLVKIGAAVLGGVFGVVSGSLAVEMGRGFGEAQRAAPMILDGDAAPRPWKRYSGWPTWDNKRFSNAAAVRSPPKPTRIRPVTAPITGDPVKGAELTTSGRGAANCLACHVVGDRGTNLPGNVGPDLSEIGKSTRTDEYLFNYIYDARIYNPDTVMPPWGAHGILSEADIRNIIAYLRTLKSPAKFKSPLDDPTRRPVPKEERDNLDPMVNPGMWAIDKAKELWVAKGPAGASCATCHHTPEPEVRFKTWAASMPRWDKRLDKVLGVEEFVYRHAKATTGHSWTMDAENNVLMATYLRNLANGATIAVSLSTPQARAAHARGKEIMERKVGRLNFSCNDCHSTTRAANRWVRGQWLTDARGYTVHFPTFRTSRSQIWDIRKRFQWCNVAIGADDLPPDAKEYGDLELYLTSLSNGLKLSVPGIRP